MKLDAPLIAMLEARELDAASTLPVVVRCNVDTIDRVSSLITSLGGRIRHQLRMLGAVAAWVPLGHVPEVARDGAVKTVELEQEFAVA
jgi:hypothetical protein